MEKHRGARRTLASLGCCCLAVILGSQGVIGDARANASQAKAPEDSGSLPYTVTDSVPVVLGPDPTGGIQPFAPDPVGAVDGAYPQLLVDLYVPDAPGSYPLVQMSHGINDDKADWANWGRRLASRGFVVVVSNRRPQNVNQQVQALNSNLDSRSLDSNAAALSFNVATEDILRILRWAIAQSKTAAGSPLFGKVDGTRLAITGHSAGGYLATLAAYRSQIEGPGLKALVLFDPADYTNKFHPTDPTDPMDTALNKVSNTDYPDSLDYAPKLTIPTADLAAEEDDTGVRCNEPKAAACALVANQEYVALAASTPKLGLKVVCSHHDESEDPDYDDTNEPGGEKFQDPICRGALPAPNADRQRLIRRYGMAWLEYWLQSDCSVSRYLGGSAFAGDQSARLITTLPNDGNVLAAAATTNPNHITNTQVNGCSLLTSTSVLAATSQTVGLPNTSSISRRAASLPLVLVLTLGSLGVLSWRRRQGANS